MAEWKEEEHPRADDGKFTDGKGFYRQNTPYSDVLKFDRERDVIRLPDEQIPRSVGAKWSNEKIRMPDGSYACFEEGSKLQNKEVFAGNGCKRKIDDIQRLVDTYQGTQSEKWMKVKAIGRIIWNGEHYSAELHWYEEPSIGKVEFKVKDD